MPCTKSMSQGSEDLDWTKNLCLSNLTGTETTEKGDFFYEELTSTVTCLSQLKKTVASKGNCQSGRKKNLRSKKRKKRLMGKQERVAKGKKGMGWPTNFTQNCQTRLSRGASATR